MMGFQTAAFLLKVYPTTENNTPVGTFTGASAVLHWARA